MSNIKECFISRFPGGSLVEMDYCLHPNTKVLTHEFKYKPIKELRIGDELVGFEEKLRKYNRTQFKKVVVTGIKSLTQPCIKLTFNDGESVISSANHYWVGSHKYSGSSLKWSKTKDFKIDDYIPQVCEVWDDLSKTPSGAWMSGFLDGEGYITNASRIGVGQNKDEAHNCIWDKMLPILERDFKELSYSPNKFNKVVRVSPNGLRTAWQGVGMYQPVRLLKKLQETYEGTILRSKRNRKRIITNMEYLGEQEVIALETDLHTFIAEGMPSHNSQLEIIGLAVLSDDTNLKTAIRNKMDIHCLNTANLYHVDYQMVFDAYRSGDKKWTEKRRLTKAFTFQLQYGAGAESMARDNDVPVSVAKNFIQSYYTSYPAIKIWQDNNIAQVKGDAVPTTKKSKKGYPVAKSHLKTATGRSYEFTEYDSPDFMKEKGIHTSFSPTQIKNYPVQGFSTGDIVPLAIGEVVKHLYMNNVEKIILPVNTVHDSIMFDVEDISYSGIITHLGNLKDIMESIVDNINFLWPAINFDLPLRVDTKYGENWGQMKELTFY